MARLRAGGRRPRVPARDRAQPLHLPLGLKSLGLKSTGTSYGGRRRCTHVPEHQDPAPALHR